MEFICLSDTHMRLPILVLCLMSLVSCAQLGGFEPDGVIGGDTGNYARAIPRRGKTAMTGSEFVRYVQSMSIEQREKAILRELRSGNLPSFLRRLRSVQVSAKQGAQTLKGQVWVMPDYLAVGSDDDFVYVPMNPLTAQRVADHFGFVLPTRKLVDDVYAQSGTRLKPATLTPGPAMVSTDYYRKHSDLIKAQRQQLGAAGNGEIVSGHKKDVVITNRLCQARRRVAIYGWHRDEGRPIQPLSTVHGETYADYSHGIRLVAHTMVVDGVEHPVEEVLQDARWAPLLSDEGTLQQTRIATDCTNC